MVSDTARRVSDTVYLVSDTMAKYQTRIAKCHTPAIAILCNSEKGRPSVRLACARLKKAACLI